MATETRFHVEEACGCLIHRNALTHSLWVSRLLKVLPVLGGESLAKQEESS